MAKAASADHTFHERFFKRLARSDNCALLLDYDQTISLFGTSQCNVSSDASIQDLLHAIMTGGRTRVILISDLQAVRVVELLQMSPAPEIWGLRGLERRTSTGRSEMLDIPNEAEQALAAVDLSLEAQGLGRFTEVEPGAIIVRWGGLARRIIEEVRERVADAWLTAHGHRWLVMREFEGGIEFRFRLWSKYEAVQQLLCEVGADVPVAYLGDERSDEDAFRALKHHDGLCVLVRQKFIPTAADVWLQTAESPCSRELAFHSKDTSIHLPAICAPQSLQIRSFSGPKSAEMLQPSRYLSIVERMMQERTRRSSQFRRYRSPIPNSSY
jgi:trehalose-6-phosphatase